MSLKKATESRNDQERKLLEEYRSLATKLQHIRRDIYQLRMLDIVKTYENVKLQEIVVADEDFIVKYTHDTEFYNSDNYKIPYYELRDIPFESAKKDKFHSKKIKFGKIGDRYFISGDRFHIYLLGNVMRIRAESYKHEFSTDEHIKYLTLLSGNCYVPEYIALRFFLALAPHRIMPDTIKRIFQF